MSVHWVVPFPFTAADHAARAEAHAAKTAALRAAAPVAHVLRDTAFYRWIEEDDDARRWALHDLVLELSVLADQGREVDAEDAAQLFVALEER